MPIRYLLIAIPLMVAGLLASVPSTSPSTAVERASLDITWRVEQGDYTYRLRGRYSIAGVADGFATRVASEATPEAATSQVDIPPGVYSVTLEAGYTLERFAAQPSDAEPWASEDESVEVVPASLVTPNPVLVLAKAGRTAHLGLSLVALPGAGTEPELTCMNGS